LIGARLRDARAQDGAALAAVFGAARAEMRYLPQLHTPAEDVAFFSERVLPTSHVTVAEVVTGTAAAAGSDPEVAGFSAVRDGWLDHLYVIPSRQGGGIGGALLARAMDESPEGLTLWAFAANHGAIALYGRAGFAEVRRSDGSGNEERVPDVLMRWGGLRG
jgi:GNAT superfamily N-acetyltransferase